MKARYLIVLPAVLTLGLLVAGCSTKKEASPAPAATTTTTAPAAAATPATTTPAAASATGPSFSAADVDKNGNVSFSEAQKIWPKLTQAQFSAADTNKDGSFSADEFAALMKNPPGP